jgi:hypothetical protein
VDGDEWGFARENRIRRAFISLTTSMPQPWSGILSAVRAS